MRAPIISAMKLAINFAVKDALNATETFWRKSPTKPYKIEVKAEAVR